MRCARSWRGARISLSERDFVELGLDPRALALPVLAALLGARRRHRRARERRREHELLLLIGRALTLRAEETDVARDDLGLVPLHPVHLEARRPEAALDAD